MLDFTVPTTVVNVKGHVDCDVYVGRTKDGLSSLLARGGWGNPYTHVAATARKHSFLVLVSSREEAVDRYRDLLKRLIARDRERGLTTTVDALAALQGKRLGCWCAPEACHADVLAKAADWAVTQVAYREIADASEAEAKAPAAPAPKRATAKPKPQSSNKFEFWSGYSDPVVGVTLYG